MVGFRIQIYLIIILSLSIIGGIETDAQTGNSRIERALINEGDQAEIYISIPRARSIETTQFIADSQNIELDVVPVPSTPTLWLVIDQSEAVVNTAPSIQASIIRFIDGISSETPIGILLYNSTTNVYMPSTNRNELETWFSNYSGQSNTSNCINTALNDIQNRIQDTVDVYRILLVTGAPIRQGNCTDTLPEMDVPIDLVVISDTIAPDYQDITDRFDGTLWRANLQTISNRLDEVRSLWASPIYELSGTIPSGVTDGTLTITLSDNTTETLLVQLEQPILDSDDSTTRSGTLSSLNDMVTQQPTPQSSENNVASNTVDVIQPTEVTVANEVNTNNEEATAVPQATESEMTATDRPSNTVAIQATAVIATPEPINDTNTSPSTTETDNSEGTFDLSDLDTSSVENLIADITEQVPLPILIGGGVFILLLLILILRIIFRPRSKKATSTSTNAQPVTPNSFAYNPNTPSNVGSNEIPVSQQHTETVIEATILEFNEGSNVQDELDMTEMFDVEPEPEPTPPPVDDFEFTEIVTEEELLASKKSPIVAKLTNVTTGEIYEIRRPQTILGRSDDCDIVIRDDKKVSRKHLTFVVNNDDEISVEIHTANPILLNDNTMKEGEIITFDDELTLTPATTLIITPVEESDTQI